MSRFAAEDSVTPDALATRIAVRSGLHGRLPAWGALTRDAGRHGVPRSCPNAERRSSGALGRVLRPRPSACPLTRASARVGAPRPAPCVGRRTKPDRASDDPAHVGGRVKPGAAASRTRSKARGSEATGATAVPGSSLTSGGCRIGCWSTALPERRLKMESSRSCADATRLSPSPRIDERARFVIGSHERALGDRRP
jgi:hypothetical protein